MPPTRVFVVTGPSGAGKGTLIKALVERMPGLELAVSATTRLRRKGEEEGRDYYFLSDGEFAKRVAEGDFLEHVTYVSGQRYGTLRSEIDRIAAAGRTCVLELERRLRERATESAGEIGERLDLAQSQLRQEDEFDYVVQNDSVDRAVEELVALVRRSVDSAATMAGP